MHGRLQLARRGSSRPWVQPLAAWRTQRGSAAGRPRPALPPARAMAQTAGVAAPWQGGCQRAKAAATTTMQRRKDGLGHPLEKRMILPL
ncbi:hypothetical protein GW17_00034948 [Ensete ventricosum]|nr:hypothetical protein GW17_00034948 [Ensete ventricosum]